MYIYQQLYCGFVDRGSGEAGIFAQPSWINCWIVYNRWQWWLLILFFFHLDLCIQHFIHEVSLFFWMVLCTMRISIWNSDVGEGRKNRQLKGFAWNMKNSFELWFSITILYISTITKTNWCVCWYPYNVWHLRVSAAIWIPSQNLSNHWSAHPTKPTYNYPFFAFTSSQVLFFSYFIMNAFNISEIIR